MDPFEQRAHRRLPISIRVLARGEREAEPLQPLGITTNISSGGLYLHTNGPVPHCGDPIHIRLRVPPTPGVADLGAELSAQTHVLRIDSLPSPPTSGSSEPRYGVALQFCKPPAIHL
ncbi:MAG TPA: PilZ domain-containing protein [Phycisphaerales bacterium]|nr:PilZ domain-containing protein [Phycisphaerales bacterium]